MYICIYFDKKYLPASLEIVNLVNALARVHCLSPRYFCPGSGSVVFTFDAPAVSSDLVPTLVDNFFHSLHDCLPSLYVSNICPFTTYKQFNYSMFTFQLKQNL